MAVKTTATVVLHDAHVACRAALPAQAKAFVGAYQSVCCLIAAVAIACVARRDARAERYTAYGEAHAATKAANAATVARKEAAEQYASRVSRRAAAKAAAAPAVRASKKAAAEAAKVVRAMRNAAILAIRAQRAAAKASAVIAATKAAIDKAYALDVAHATTEVAPTPVVAPATVNVYSIVVFLAMTPCLAALWFVATFNTAAKAADKEAAKAANRIRASIRAPRVPMNTPEKRASITLACANARASKAARAAADASAIALFGSVMSQRTIDARAAQGAAQREANAARKAATPAKTPGVHVVIVRTGPTKSKGAKRVHAPRVHTVESALAQVAKKQAIIKAKEDAAILKAKKWALRKEAYANRKAAMEVIAADAWMNAGVWLSEDLIRGANDWSYQVRIAAFKEARAIAYPPKTKAVATTGGAA